MKSIQRIAKVTIKVVGPFLNYLTMLNGRSGDLGNLVNFIRDNNLEQAEVKGLMQGADMDDNVRASLLMYYVNYMSSQRFVCYNTISIGSKSCVFLARPGNGFSGTVSDVAVKVVLDYESDNKVYESLMNEASIMCRIEHPNIVYGYEAVSMAELTYFIMEYVYGNNLEELIHNTGRIGQQSAFRMAKQMVDALGYLNEWGYVHCDIKPSNFMLDVNGNVKLCDMGLSKSVNSMDGSGNEIVGTMFYIAPELIKGKSCDIGCDVYSFGATLYHMLSGRPPFLAANTKDLLDKHVKLKPIPLSSVDNSLNPDLCRIIGKCLEKEPADRFCSFNELSEEFKKLDNVFKTATLE